MVTRCCPTRLCVLLIFLEAPNLEKQSDEYHEPDLQSGLQPIGQMATTFLSVPSRAKAGLLPRKRRTRRLMDWGGGVTGISAVALVMLFMV